MVGKGILFKYNADPDDPLLKDRRDFDICRGFIDPDFWTNSSPVWSVCGPYVRKILKKGDVVYFLPCKRSYKEAGYSDYICSGFLVVNEFLTKDEFLRRSDIKESYKADYRVNIEAHLRRDRSEAPRTEEIRVKNIVIGSAESRWLGKNDENLRQVLRQRGINIDLGAQVIKHLSTGQSQSLYSHYISSLPQHSP